MIYTLLNGIGPTAVLTAWDDLSATGEAHTFLAAIDTIDSLREISNASLFSAVRQHTGRPIQRISFQGDIWALAINPGISTLNVPPNNEPKKMNTVPLTPAGYLLSYASVEIPQLARDTLGKYANQRLKDLKFVTKAFKYLFPFYDAVGYKRSFCKIASILQKTMAKNIPYLETSKVPFIETTSISSDRIFIRMGPYQTRAPEQLEQSKHLSRYIQVINKLIRRADLPLHLTITGDHYIRAPEPGKSYSSYYPNRYATQEETNKNTYEVFTVTVTMSSTLRVRGYLLIHYMEDMLKVLETLHRKAHYAETTFRPNTQN